MNNIDRNYYDKYLNQKFEKKMNDLYDQYVNNSFYSQEKVNKCVPPEHRVSPQDVFTAAQAHIESDKIFHKKTISRIINQYVKANTLVGALSVFIPVSELEEKLTPLFKEYGYGVEISYDYLSKVYLGCTLKW